MSKGEYKDGFNFILMTFLLLFGQLSAKENIKKFLLEGEWVIYYDNGQLHQNK